MHAGDTAIVLLNKFPYSSGHLMVAPRRHVGALGELTDDEALEIHRLAVASVDVLTRVYGPGGFNLGWNLGRVAGAGIADHVHLHVVPALGGRHELHAGARGREGDPGAPARDPRPAARRVADYRLSGARDFQARGGVVIQS